MLLNTLVGRQSLGLMAIFVAASTAGCGLSSSAAIYRKPPLGIVKYGTGKVPIDPDDYAVDPHKYPVYEAQQDFDPPSAQSCWANFVGSKRGCSLLPQTKILASDVWHVTHIVGDRYLIESDAYNERECRFLNKKGYSVVAVNIFGSCLRDYNFAIYISADGNVSGGWELLPSPRKILSARYTYLIYVPSKNKGWPSGQVFDQVTARPDHSE